MANTYEESPAALAQLVEHFKTNGKTYIDRDGIHSPTLFHLDHEGQTYGMDTFTLFPDKDKDPEPYFYIGADEADAADVYRALFQI